MRAQTVALVLCSHLAFAGEFALGSIGNDGGSGTPTESPAGPDISTMPFTPDSIRKVVQFHLPKIQSCYEETLAPRQKVVEGRLMTSWVITAEGAVKQAKVVKKGTTLREPKLHECVITVLSTMSFPKPIDRRDHPIDYPFNLKAIQ